MAIRGLYIEEKLLLELGFFSRAGDVSLDADSDPKSQLPASHSSCAPRKGSNSIQALIRAGVPFGTLYAQWLSGSVFNLTESRITGQGWGWGSRGVGGGG